MIDRELLYGISGDEPHFVALRLQDFLANAAPMIETARTALQDPSPYKVSKAIHELSKIAASAGVVGPLRHLTEQARAQVGKTPREARFPESLPDFLATLDQLLPLIEAESIEARRLLQELE